MDLDSHSVYVGNNHFYLLFILPETIDKIIQNKLEFISTIGNISHK